MSIILSLVAALVGAALAVPGILPKSGTGLIRAARVATGSGLVVMAIGRIADAPTTADMGLAFLVAGLAAFIFAIVWCA